MDEYTDLFDDSNITTDTPAGDDNVSSGEDVVVDSGVDPSFEDVLRDVLNDYFGNDESDQEGDETSGSETDVDVEEGSDTEHGSETETEESPSFDIEIISEINETLHQHTDDVSRLMSGVTVSGNSVLVSLDSDSIVLLSETLEKQDEVIEKFDYTSGLISIVLSVLIFDLMHRFAKRIIKNMTRGDDDKNAADS